MTRWPAVARPSIFVRRALRIAPDDPVVVADAAYVLGYYGEDISAAMALIDRALELNPSFADGWRNSGWLRLWAGQPDRGIVTGNLQGTPAALQAFAAVTLRIVAPGD